MKALLIGIGKAGLGVIAPTFIQAGYNVTATHYNQEKLDLLNNGYTLKTPSKDFHLHLRTKHIGLLKDEYDLIITCVGRKNLRKIIAWYKQNKFSAPIFFAENLFSPDLFEIDNIPIVIDRICTDIEVNNKRYVVKAEDYKKIITLKATATTALQSCDSVILLKNASEVELERKRKLYTINVAHKLVGLYALNSKCIYVEEAVSNEMIARKLKECMREIAPFLNKDQDEMDEITKTILERLKSPTKDRLTRIYNPNKDDTAIEYVANIINYSQTHSIQTPLMDEVLNTLKDIKK
jgi:siroheme synthase (precorrin-2 oxidase/ferrochelatase)